MRVNVLGVWCDKIPYVDRMHLREQQPATLYCCHCRHTLTVVNFGAPLLYFRDSEHVLCSRRCAIGHMFKRRLFRCERCKTWCHQIAAIAFLWLDLVVVGDLDPLPMQRWWWRRQHKQRKWLLRQHMWERSHPRDDTVPQPHRMICGDRVLQTFQGTIKNLRGERRGEGPLILFEESAYVDPNVFFKTYGVEGYASEEEERVEDIAFQCIQLPNFSHFRRRRK